MKNIFTQIQLSKPKYNTFDLTHDVKMSGKMGWLMPCLTMECIPGDKINLGCDTLVRFAPLVAPVMHRMDVTTHYFFVPNRLVWENWETFIVNESTGGIPFITIDAALTPEENRFIDYMGICPFANSGGQTTPDNVSAIPFAAYQKIYNEYYRDQNLVTEVTAADLTDGDNTANLSNLLTLRKRAWEHDYFTSALPFAQKGTAVDIPLGDVNLKASWNSGPTINPRFVDAANLSVSGDITQVIDAGKSSGFSIDNNGSFPQVYDPDGTLEVGSTTITDLRRAFKLQEWFERNARAGIRYIENILAHFGVRSSDKRLQRPEYITGSRSPVIISEVLQTSETSGTAQGGMAGHGVSVGNGYVGTYNVEEHGYIIGIMSIMPKPAYMDGIPKTFTKTDPLEFFWPSFANIGEQPILNKELFAYTALKEGTFGYTPRYAEYKFMSNRVAGDFRSTLYFWHVSRMFTGLPSLNQTFIEMNEDDVMRIFAVDMEDNLYIHILHKIKAVRAMPVFGTPML